MTDFLTQAQIAALECRCERTVARWRIIDHSFPKPIALPCGGRVLFRRADYEAWRARRDQQEEGPLDGGDAHETVEDALRLDLAQPAVRKALERRALSDGTWTWSCGRSNIANIGYTWARFSSRLFLRYACNGQPIIQTIALKRTTPNFGGQRWWFICPVNGQRVRALYLPSGATRWASRVAHNFRYESQRASGPFTRLVRQLRRDGAREARNEVRRIARGQRRGDFAA